MSSLYTRHYNVFASGLYVILSYVLIWTNNYVYGPKKWKLRYTDNKSTKTYKCIVAVVAKLVTVMWEWVTLGGAH